MTEAYADTPPSADISPAQLALIESEIKLGLPNETKRLDDALFNLEFFRGDFSRFPTRPTGFSADQHRYPRRVLLMQRVVKILTANLYKAGPVRRLPDHPEAEEWLANVYRKYLVDALWQEADGFAVVSQAAAFQVAGWSDPDCPIKPQLWDASCFVAWCHPDDPCRPNAVATIDRVDEQRRLRLWTSTELQTWTTDKLRPGQTAGGTAYRKIKSEPNLYGVVPFSFAHFHFPVTDFWAGSPGTHLREANDGTNFFLTENFDNVRYNLRPILHGKNVRPGWRPPSPVNPGDYWDVPSGELDATGNDKQPELAYLQSDPSFIAAGWDDQREFLEHMLEMNGVPASAIRLEQSGARSGVSIVVEQIPLILWAQGRQRPFSKYEDDLAKLCLTVGAAHLRTTGGRSAGVTVAQLEAAAEAPGLVLHWPDMFPDLPGPERDQGDQWELENGLTSRTSLLMRRGSLTREEAEERLEEIAEDLEREAKLFAKATPEALKPKDDGQGEGEGDDDESDDDDETTDETGDNESNEQGYQ